MFNVQIAVGSSCNFMTFTGSPQPVEPYLVRHAHATGNNKNQISTGTGRKTTSRSTASLYTVVVSCVSDPILRVRPLFQDQLYQNYSPFLPICIWTCHLRYNG